MVNRIKSPAPGLAGDGPGKPARFEINDRAVSSAGQQVISKGDTVVIETGGGGGFGAPDSDNPG